MILNFSIAYTECGLYAGIIIISHVVKRCFLPEIIISTTPSRTSKIASYGVVCSLSP